MILRLLGQEETMIAPVSVFLQDGPGAVSGLGTVVGLSRRFQIFPSLQRVSFLLTMPVNMVTGTFEDCPGTNPIVKKASVRRQQ